MLYCVKCTVPDIFGGLIHVALPVMVECNLLFTAACNKFGITNFFVHPEASVSQVKVLSVLRVNSPAGLGF